MVLGVGVDLVDISEVKRFMELERNGFIEHTFTEAEKAIGEKVPDIKKAEYYAGLFACKEAVFKAIGHRTHDKVWDFRFIETLHHEDGAPYVNITPKLQEYMDEAGVGSFCVSVSNENDYAVAFVIAQD